MNPTSASAIYIICNIQSVSDLMISASCPRNMTWLHIGRHLLCNIGASNPVYTFVAYLSVCLSIPSVRGCCLERFVWCKGPTHVLLMNYVVREKWRGSKFYPLDTPQPVAYRERVMLYLFYIGISVQTKLAYRTGWPSALGCPSYGLRRAMIFSMEIPKLGPTTPKLASSTK